MFIKFYAYEITMIIVSCLKIVYDLPFKNINHCQTNKVPLDILTEDWFGELNHFFFLQITIYTLTFV